MMLKSRIQWIDSWRGMMILIIVAWHILGGGLNISVDDSPMLLNRIYVWTQSFHTISFFGISGLVWSGGILGFSTYLIKCTRNLLVPYMVIGVVSMLSVGLLSSIVLQEYSLGKDVLMFLSFGEPQFNRPLWFLPCLFMVMLLYYGVDRLTRTWWLKILGVFGIASVWVCVPLRSYCALPFSLNIVPIFLLAFAMWNLIGGLVIRVKDGVNWNVLRPVWLVVGVVLMVLMLRYPYYGGGICGILVRPWWILGCIAATMFVAWAIDCKPLAWVGRGSMTLGILCLHKFPILALQQIPFIKKLYHQGLYMSISLDVLITIIAVALSVVMTILVARYAPWVFGRSKALKMKVR